ncbi:MAG TPA: hypothetical protein VHG90_00150 [Acidimicrobiales bacterium]|nr:hypothetical protein [Acidimicrobiales bacterium]
MADDDRLLELLGRALAPPPVEPPPERVAAFRALIAQGRPEEASEPEEAASPDAAEPRHGELRPLPPIVDRRPAPPSVPELARGRARRVGWLAAGASVAAAAVVIAVLAVPSLFADRSQPGASVETARAAVARLRTALATGDPIAVAEADAELVRVAGRLPRDEQVQVHTEAVSAHVEAIEFLRETRGPAAPPTGPAGGQVAAPGTRAAPAPQQAPPTSAAPAAGSASRPPPPAPPVATTAPPARSVTIIVVSPQLDGSFEVEFGTAGFTPEPGRKPGTYAIRFSFDDGQSPTVWTKSDPWRFPREHAVTYRQVCARVVDWNGVEDPASGGCRNIL